MTSTAARTSEQLLNAAREELHNDERVGDNGEPDDDDELQDERHRLIAREGAGRGFSSGGANGRSNRRGHNQQALFGDTNVMGRLGTLLGVGKTASLSQIAAGSPHDHKADFVYQSGWSADGERAADGAVIRNRVGQSAGEHEELAADHLRRLSFASSQDRHNQGSHWTQPSRRRNTCRMIVSLVVFATFCGLVIKLASLIRDERVWLMSGNQSAQLRSSHELVRDLTQRLDRQHKQDLELTRQQRWLVSSPKCHIPVLEPWDKSIESYVRRKPPMNCSAVREGIEKSRREDPDSLKELPPFLQRAVSYVDANRLFFTDEALRAGALWNQFAPGQCCLKRVARKEDDDDQLEWGPCEPVHVQGASVNSSVVEVFCAAWNYTNVHSFIVHDPREELPLAEVARRKLKQDDQDFYSVLLLGVDTISRLNGQRQLSKTLATLGELYTALDFVGYNKVAENTFPNLIPLLTGLKPEQLAEVQCWQSANYSQANEVGEDYLDNCKFLWNFYQQVGYLTYIGEDWPQASTFNYLKPGFRFQPSTFYGRPFSLARDHLVYPKFESPGCAACQLDRPLVEVDLANLRAFILNNANKLPYFALHWINCPQHDDLNGASQFDHILERFFREMRDKLEADRTFVVFFSDHGYRWNDFVSTRVGHYESSLPLMTIAPPRAFIQRHPELYERMRAHQNALLTPFDLFKTLIALKDLGAKTSGRVSERSTAAAARVGGQQRSGASRPAEEARAANATAAKQSAANAVVKQLKFVDGTTFRQKFSSLSLFDSHSPQQLDRGCIEAGIPDNYCVCHQFAPVEPARLDVLGAAYYLVHVHLDARLRNHLSICHRLELERVHHAEMFNLEASAAREKTGSALRRLRRERLAGQAAASRTSAKPATHLHGANDEQNKHDYLPNREYSVMFSTKPGGGLFQEVVRFYGASMADCERQVAKTRTVVEDEWAKAEDKRESVLTMNDVCDFSVHSESLSRFNLYKDQSKCVKSDIELKKVCYCNDLARDS